MIYIGSARHDENGKYAGGKAGDQLQNSGKSGYIGSDDHDGEVSMQEFYVHSKGWTVLRPKDIKVADKIADAMAVACNNPNIGYDQGLNDRTSVVRQGVDTETLAEGDCGSLIRACVKHATGIDAGNFSTADEVKVLSKTGLFLEAFKYTNKTPILTEISLQLAQRGTQ